MRKEEVTKDDGEVLLKEYKNLLEKYENFTKIITLPWWHDTDKNNVITKVALETNSFLVDISHLGNGFDEQCFARSYKKYKMPGIGAHPSDYGMEKIADNLFTVFNAIM